jgi:hypothetical protein
MYENVQDMGDGIQVHSSFHTAVKELEYQDLMMSTFTHQGDHERGIKTWGPKGHTLSVFVFCKHRYVTWTIPSTTRELSLLKKRTVKVCSASESTSVWTASSSFFGCEGRNTSVLSIKCSDSGEYVTMILDGASQQQEDAPLTIPQLNRLTEASLVRDEDASNVAVTAIPAQNRVTLQILRMCQPFKDLKQTFAVSRRVEQLRLRAQQRVVATVEDSVLRTEMENLESEEEDAPGGSFGISP